MSTAAAACPLRREREGTPLRKLLASLVLLCLAAATGCASTALFQPRIGLGQLSFEVAPGANDDTPFALELVAVTDDEVLKKLQEVTAAQWFDPHANWRGDYPKALRSWYYELTPGRHWQLPQPLPFTRQPGRALLLFANYKGPGAYRLRLESFKKARVLFAASGISVDPVP